ncbi:hypothetical protein WR25_05478 [Diploscapter pachys]|uniref:Fibrinogen C-terminal domain-containing protein n=1 Tax=Diploscapter pachys TaxID=2018661 RepID=A0A2A2LWT0_9BILA|nr:hypothetical protein WR25_05478 [Diploscapter pachys]
MLFKSIFSLILVQSILADAPGPYCLKVFLAHYENPAGTLDSGEPCSEFANMGAQCSMYFQACVDVLPLGEGQTACAPTGDSNNFGLITRGSNKYDFFDGQYGTNAMAQNPIIKPSSDGNFNSFRVTVKVTSQTSDGPSIDQFSFDVDVDSELNAVGSYTYSSKRRPYPTSLTVAWSAKSELTTGSPATVVTGATGVTHGTEPAGTGTSGAPQTSVAPVTTAPSAPIRDCEDFTGGDRANGIKSIIIEGAPVQVYCEYGANGVGSLTTFQSRGSDATTNAAFNNAKSVDAYKVPFGAPGKGSNSWIGLDNLANLTNSDISYYLRIDLCCGGASKSTQLYHNFKIMGPQYILNADPDIKNIGMDYWSSDTSKKDIGQPFATYQDLSPAFRDFCNMMTLYDYIGDVEVYGQGQGGWWFGSCGNNLNGLWIAKDNSNCAITSFPNITDPLKTIKAPGIELKLASSPLIYDPTGDNIQWDMEAISYDRSVHGSNLCANKKLARYENYSKNFWSLQESTNRKICSQVAPGTNVCRNAQFLLANPVMSVTPYIDAI